eukprot:COSAG02_NODE_842_length_16609_cov_117.586675_7_plen_135_part_00
MLVPNWLLVIGSAILLAVAGKLVGNLREQKLPGNLGNQKKTAWLGLSGIEPPTLRIKQRRVPKLLARSLGMVLCGVRIFKYIYASSLSPIQIIVQSISQCTSCRNGIPYKMVILVVWYAGHSPVPVHIGNLGGF